ncbi:MAG: lysoplasmalogenase family protein [Sphingomonas sp.]|uniref:lysoplasmalogenase family protein n=1 Tax=Sphingomonas sp. TaxID=28214 RepID=UPI003F7DA8D2
MIATPPKLRALWLFLLALVAGASFWFVGQHTVPTLPWMAWKGAGVALLAVWAAVNAHNRDGWLITAVMLFGALGDVLLERSQTDGALAFLAGHLTAVLLYLSHRRAKPTPSQIALAILLLIAVPVIAFLLPADRTGAPGIALYATGLGAMAASAWISRFPRYRVGLGAVMFVASDLLIFAKIGPFSGSLIPIFLIWPLYFAGQALIAWGAVTTLLRWKDDEDLHHRL